MEVEYSEILVQRLKKYFNDIELMKHKDTVNDSLHCYSIFTSFKDYKVYATGMDLNPSVAKSKAISEFSERIVFFSQNDLEFDGYAAHPTKEMAIRNSTYELIERDIFLTCWLLKIPPTIIPPLEIEALISQEYLSIYRDNNSEDFQQTIGILGISDKIITCCGFITSKKEGLPFGFILTTAAHENLSVAVQKVILDLRRSINMARTFLEEDSSCDEFNHINFYMNPKHLKDVSWFLKPTLEKEVKIFPTLEINSHLIQSFPIKNWPVFTARSKSTDAQKYFFGETTPEKVNLEKFKSIYNKDFRDLNLQVHPLG